MPAATPTPTPLPSFDPKTHALQTFDAPAPPQHVAPPSHTFHHAAALDLCDARAAHIVANAVTPDPELRPAVVTRTVLACGARLHLALSASDARALRAAVASLYDFVLVAATAVRQLPPLRAPASDGDGDGDGGVGSAIPVEAVADQPS